MIKIGEWIHDRFSNVCKVFLFFVAIILVSSTGRTQNVVSVQSSIDQEQVGLGQELQLTLTVITSGAEEIETPNLPDIPGFELVNSHTSTAISQKMVNTKSGMNWIRQSKKEYIFILEAKQLGTHSIPEMKVKVGGQEHRTQGFKVSVVKEQKASPKINREEPDSRYPFPGGPQFDDIDKLEEELFNQMLKQRQGFSGRGEKPRESRNININPNEAFFILAETDKKEVYEGEQVTVAWYIYTRGQLETLDRVKFPSLRGFWKEIIEEVPMIQFTEEIVNGIVYHKALLGAHALFPIKAGEAVIDEYKIKSRVRLPVQGFGFGRAFEYTRSSRPNTIKVKPLPLTGRPANFSGAVGLFEVNSKVEANQFFENQPFSFKIRFDGNGNAKLIELPAIEWPPGLEVYDTKSESKFFKDGRSYKEFEVILIPRKQGTIAIPELSLGLFDPSAGQYYQRKSAGLEITVAPGKTVNSSSAPMVTSEKGRDEKWVPELDVATSNSLWSQSETHFVFWLMVFVLLVAFVLLRLLWAFELFGRQKSLEQKLKIRLEKVDKLAQKGSYRQVGAELTNITYILLGSISGEGAGTKEVEKLLDKCPPSFRHQLGAQVSKQFELFQSLTFAPDEMLGSFKSPQALKKIIEDSRQLFALFVKFTKENS